MADYRPIILPTDGRSREIPAADRLWVENLKVTDAGLLVVDQTDQSKTFKLELNGLPTATDKVLSIPGSPSGLFLKDDLTWAAPSGGAAWGSITGTLSGQSDLQAALDTKAEEAYYGRLSADYTLTSQTAAQKLFNWSTNGALTLPLGVYEFFCTLYISGMSATSGNGQFQLKGGGSATLGNIGFTIYGSDVSNPTNTGTNAGVFSNTENSPASMVTGATGTAMRATINGLFEVTGAGTIIPSIALVTAAAAIVENGSSFLVCKLSTGSTNGDWS